MKYILIILTIFLISCATLENLPPVFEVTRIINDTTIEARNQDSIHFLDGYYYDYIWVGAKGKFKDIHGRLYFIPEERFHENEISNVRSLDELLLKH